MDYEALYKEIDDHMEQLKTRAMPCLHCNILMIGTSKTDNQKYCSPECRQAYYKEEKRARQQRP
jgi:predicted nucleic acid-binding Zn ribbon protein